MSEREKLLVDMLKGLSLGFLGAILFRDFAALIDGLFFLGAGITFAGAWFLSGPKTPR